MPRPLIAADRVKINLVNTSGNTNLVLAALLKQERIFDQLGLDADILHVADLAPVGTPVSIIDT